MEPRPIHDWSPEARRRLYREHEPQIRTLLYVAFLDFADKYGLGTFRFSSEDAIGEAVDWCVSAWNSDRVIDPTKLRSRSFAIFSSPLWWLAQREGKAGFLRKMEALKRLRTETSVLVEARSASFEADLHDRHLVEFADGLADTLRVLFERTCRDLVTLWLAHTHRYRASWFGWRTGSTLPERLARLGGARRSKLAHDALFRYVCLHLGLVADEPATGQEAAVVETMFRRCENTSPYRVSDANALSAVERFGATGSRQVTAWRKEGLGAWLRAVLDLLETEPLGNEVRFRWVVVRLSVSSTTLHVYRLTDADLAARIGRLPAPEAIGGDHAD